MTLFWFPQGPGVVSGVQGTYPYVVWNPPEEPNGVITGYRLVFSRSGTSTTRTVTTTNDQTFYIIQSSNIPWTSGDFRVTVSLPLFYCYLTTLDETTVAYTTKYYRPTN